MDFISGIADRVYTKDANFAAWLTGKKCALDEGWDGFWGILYYLIIKMYHFSFIYFLSLVIYIYTVDEMKWMTIYIFLFVMDSVNENK